MRPRCEPAVGGVKIDEVTNRDRIGLGCCAPQALPAWSRCGASLPDRRLPAGSQMQDSAVSPEGTHRPLATRLRRRARCGRGRRYGRQAGVSSASWSALGSPSTEPPSPADALAEPAYHPGPRPRRWPARRPSARRRRPAWPPASRPGCAPRRPRPSTGPTRPCGAGPRPGREPHGSTGVTGESEPRASMTPAAAIAANGLRARARSTPRRWAYMPASPPHSRSKAGCTDATTPSRAKVGEHLGRGHLDVLDAVPRGPDRGGAELLLGQRRGRSQISPSAPSPMAWKPACSPARVQATTWSRTSAASR